MLYYKVAEYSRLIYSRGLTVANGGNVSMRSGEYMWITPKKRGFRTLGDVKAYEIIRVPIEDPMRDPRASSESRMHAEIYKKTNRRAIIHAHPPKARSKLHRGEIFKVPNPEGVLEEVPHIKYYEPGTEELAKAVAEAMDERGIVLMLHHGVVTAGRTLREAMLKLELVELGALI